MSFNTGSSDDRRWPTNYHQHDFSIERPSVDLGPPVGHGAIEWECSICGKTPEQVREERTQREDCRE